MLETLVDIQDVTISPYPLGWCLQQSRVHPIEPKIHHPKANDTKGNIPTSNFCQKGCTLQGINISHLGEKENNLQNAILGGYWRVVLLKDPPKNINWSKGDAWFARKKNMAASLWDRQKKSVSGSESTLEWWSLSWYPSRWQQELVKEIWKEISYPTSHASNNCFFLNFQKFPPLSFVLNCQKTWHLRFLD